MAELADEQVLHQEIDDEFLWEKEDWEVEDESLAYVLNLIERDEYDTVKELENHFDSVWMDVSCVSFVQSIHLCICLLHQG